MNQVHLFNYNEMEMLIILQLDYNTHSVQNINHMTRYRPIIADLLPPLQWTRLIIFHAIPEGYIYSYTYFQRI